MAPRPRRRRTVWPAWVLLGLGLLLALCVLTYEPADPAASLLGPLGQQLGGQLFFSLGVTVYALLTSWFVLVMMLLGGKRWPSCARRLTGWMLLIPAGAYLADVLAPVWWGHPLAGAGGMVGALLRTELEAILPFPWPWVAWSTATLLALWLALPEVVHFGARCLWACLCGVARLFRRSQVSAPVAPTPAAPVPAAPPTPAPALAPAAPPPSGDDIPIVRPKIPLVAEDEVHAPVAKAPVAPAAAPSPPIVRRQEAPPPEEQQFEDYELPSLNLLADPAPFPFEEHDQKLRERAALLEKTFKDFDLNVRVVGINTGPVITQYEIALETGMRVNKITVLGDDLALNLKVPSVRIVAPIPGKNTVGIEIPNEHRAVVNIKETILTAGKKAAKMKLPLFLGKDTEGRPLVYDLAEMPHLLIAGRTGTGKSVCLNTIILSVLMTRRPDEAKMIMIDPKMLELSEYAKVPHLMHPVVKDMKKAEAILAWAVDKMEERYDLLSRARVRSIAGYNELGLEEILRRVQPDDEERQKIHAKMPYVIIFVDEMGDLMMTMKREVEGHIIRLAQKSRAAGIHLVVATQKPTVDVITGLIKSNLPARICFQVSSRTDSRVVLDEMGAEKLLGKGDMLFLQPGTSSILRSQGTYCSDEEIHKVVTHLECDNPCYAQELIQLKTSTDGGNGSGLDKLRARDEHYEQAIEIVVREGRGSVSLLQRALGIGYGRAARLIDFMAEDGIVGAYNGSNAREVLYTPEDWEQLKQGAATA